MFDAASAHHAVRFGFTGACVFGLDVALVWFFNRFCPPLLAVSLAYFIAVTAHFCLNKWWVFQDRRAASAAQLLKYAVAVAACWLCTVIVVALALRLITPSVVVAKLIALPLATLLGFVLMRFFVFPRPADTEAGRSAARP